MPDVPATSRANDVFGFRTDILPIAFITAAFINFTAGIALGATMAINISLANQLLPIHVEVNPFGWLTMLIYGMTYAILALFAGLQIRAPLLGWLHFITAETGVMLIASASILSSQLILIIGLGLQFIAPLLFLANILSSVIYARRKRQHNPLLASTPEAAERTAALAQSFFMREFFGRSAQARDTDKIARRGTDIALIILIGGTLTDMIGAISFRIGPASVPPMPVMALVYFGWIAGTVFAVSLHLFPRYARRSVITKWQANVGQGIWLLGVLWSATGGYASQEWLSVGERILGASFLWWSLSYLIPMRKSFPGTTGAISASWRASWLFAFLLGLGLAIGWDPSSPLVLHLLFLGWITTLAYGVGYTFFPLLLGRKPRSRHLPGWQVTISVTGVALMSTAFALIQYGIGTYAFLLLAVGGLAATAGALTFMLTWPFGERFAPSVLGSEENTPTISYNR